MLSIIVAVSENNVIGRNNTIPWRLSTDLKNFKRLTQGHKVIMGRKTFDSIIARLGKPLPDRENYVYTRQYNFTYPDVKVMELGDLERFAGSPEEVFVIGGSEIYRLTLPLVRRVYLTRVHANIKGDAFFPCGPYLDWPIQVAKGFRESPSDQYAFGTSIRERP